MVPAITGAWMVLWLPTRAPTYISRVTPTRVRATTQFRYLARFFAQIAPGMTFTLRGSQILLNEFGGSQKLLYLPDIIWRVLFPESRDMGATQVIREIP